jgi:MYXO-CTERM domain-containing protein
MARILLRGSLLAAAATLGTSGIARAHFNLHEPENWLVQESDGTPQKMGPCGDPSESMPAAAMSNAVTEYKAGETIAVKLQEMITHPGHYRVALSLTGPDGLPADPMVTKADTSMNGQCGTAEIMDPPMMPILVDNALEHTAKLNGEQTIMVKLPDDVECEKCTLQVIEFMSSHPAPCFYHHCADIKITKDGSMSSGGMGAGGMSAGGMSAGGMSAGGTSAGGMSAGGAAGMSMTAGAGGVGGMGGQGVTAGTGAIVAPGGSSGAGGSSGTGGSTAPMGGTGNTAMGGSSNTTAGMAGNPTAQAGTGTTPPAAEAAKTDEEGGCSMAQGRTSSPLALLALLGLAGLRARRRR